MQSEKVENGVNVITLNQPEYRQQIEIGGVIFGGILLLVSFNTLFSPNPVIFEGDQVPERDQICFSLLGLIGLVILIFGIQGNRITENPRQTIIYELSRGALSYAQLQEKIGLKSWEFRKIIKEMEDDGTLNVEKDSKVGSRFSLK